MSADKSTPSPIETVEFVQELERTYLRTRADFVSHLLIHIDTRCAKSIEQYQNNQHMSVTEFRGRWKKEQPRFQNTEPTDGSTVRNPTTP